MVLVRVFGWLLVAVGGLADLWLMLSSSAIVAQRHGVGWVLAGWVFFPVGMFVLPIAAGLGGVMALVYVLTLVGAVMSRAGVE